MRRKIALFLTIPMCFGFMACNQAETLPMTDDEREVVGTATETEESPAWQSYAGEPVSLDW